MFLHAWLFHYDAFALFTLAELFRGLIPHVVPLSRMHSSPTSSLTLLPTLSASQQHETHFPGGSKEILFPDGTIKTVTPDGIHQSVFPDGTSMIEYPDGRKEVSDPPQK